MKNKENNKIIADFMQHPFVKKWDESKYPELNKFPYEKLKYDTSWDWLMPVVIKIKDYYVEWIRKYSTPVEPSLKKCIDDLAFELTVTISIEGLYYAVIRFINWYNLNHHNHE